MLVPEYGLDSIDGTTGSLISSVKLGNFSEGIAIDESSQTLYVANYLSASISVVSASNLAIINTIKLSNASYPSNLALDSAAGVLYSTTDENYIVAINTHTNTLEQTIQITPNTSQRTFSIAYDQKNNILYVATEPGDVISEVDGSSEKIVSTVDLSLRA